MKAFTLCRGPVLVGLLLPAIAVANEGSKVKTDEVIVNADRIALAKLTDKNATGSRLNITALDTPATIQSITGDIIRLRGDVDVVTAVTRTSGITSLATPGNGGFGFAARGFGSGSVTILYDGTKSLINTGSMTYPYDTWNVERIDALNGPASVLYGSGAIGAAINVIPRRPSAVAENTLRLTAGSLNSQSAAFDSTGPLTDKLLYRFDISKTKTDSYIQRGDTDTLAISGALAYAATDDLNFTLTADYGDREQPIYQGMLLINGVAKKSLRKINYATYDSDIAFEDHRVTLKTDWQVADDIAVRNITTYMRGIRLWHYPSQYVYQPLTNLIQVRGFGTFSQHQDQIGNYTDVSWNLKLFGFQNTLVAGIDLVHMSNDRFVDSYTAVRYTDLHNIDPGYFPGGPFTKNYQETNVDQYAVFFEDRLALNDNLSLVAGLRFDHSNIERVNIVDKTTVEKTFTPKSWRVGAVYQLAPNFNVYAQYATAVDPVSTLCCISAAQLNFDLSEGKQTEIGLKQSAWDGRLEWSLAAYQINKNNLLTPDPANPGLSIQVGAQSSHGVEATLALKLNEQWLLELNGTVLKSEYDDFAENVGGKWESRAGNRVINTPQRSANAWLTWNFAPQWSAQAGVRYVGDSYINAINTQRLLSFSVIDFGLHWDATERVAIDARGKNIFDKFYAYTSVSNGAGSGQWVLGAPRTGEVALTFKF